MGKNVQTFFWNYKIIEIKLYFIFKSPILYSEQDGVIYRLKNPEERELRVELFLNEWDLESVMAVTQETAVELRR